MRSMRINVSEFVKQYQEAIDAGLTMPEAAKLLGISRSSLHARIGQLRKRGVSLPPFRDQRERSDRRQEKAALMAARNERRRARQERKAARLAKQATPTPVHAPGVNIDALSEQVADKVYARLRDTLRFQFFVGPEVPA